MNHWVKRYSKKGEHGTSWSCFLVMTSLVVSRLLYSRDEETD